MRISGLVHVAAARVVLPEGRQELRFALERGALTRDLAESSDTSSLPTASAGQSGQDMAVEVGVEALAKAGVAAEELGLVLYAWMVDRPDNWRLAASLARRIGADRAVAVGVRQMCNGGAMATQFALSHLLTEHRTDHCLVLTGDALGPESLHRWQLGDSGAALGDSATALVLSRGSGPLSVQAVCTQGCSSQEGAYPEGNRLFTGPSVAEVDTAAFSGKLLFELRRSVRAAVDGACADAGLERGDPRLGIIVLPRVNSSLVRPLTEGLLPGSAAEKVHLSNVTGHLFAGDLTANISHLLETRPLADGEYGLLINIGSGFTVTALVVRGEENNVA